MTPAENRFILGFVITAILFLAWPIIICCSSDEGAMAFRHELTFTLFHIVVLPFITGLSFSLLPTGAVTSVSWMKKKWWKIFFGFSAAAAVVMGIFATHEYYTGRLEAYCFVNPLPVVEARDDVKAAHPLKAAQGANAIGNFKEAKKKYEKMVVNRVQTNAGPVSRVQLLNETCTWLVGTILLSLVLVRILTEGHVAKILGQSIPNMAANKMIVASTLAWPLLRLYTEWHNGWFLHETAPFAPNPMPNVVMLVVSAIAIFLWWMIGEGEDGVSWKMVGGTLVVVIAVLSVEPVKLVPFEFLESMLNNDGSAQILMIFAALLGVALFVFGRSLVRSGFVVNVHFLKKVFGT